MLTTIVGFPRIGQNRELKFLTEKFFKNKIQEQIYLKETEKIQKENILLMKNKIDLIPVNDFSLYDNTLDMMWALGIIEKKYVENKLNYLEKYFAIPRGIKKGNLDLKPYDMKKWFNTNYHYIVPKINKNLSFKTDFFFIERNIKIANEIINNFKIVLIGPYTFIKISKKEIKIEDVLEKIILNYIELLNKIIEMKVKIVQLDEPALCLESNKDDILLFKKIYQNILTDKRNLKIYLQTYFSYVDAKFIKEINKLNIDGFGLDFVEGKENLKLLNKLNLDNKILIAGVVNGKNVWLNNYDNSIKIIENISKYVKKENIILSSSCSLLFVPYKLEGENKIGKEKLKFLSFANEKLHELKEIKILLSDKKYKKNKIYIKNQNVIKFLIKLTKSKENLKIVSKIKNMNFNRGNKFYTRRKIQDRFFNLKILPTTTIGSFPQTEDIRKIRKKLKEKKITELQYENYIKRKIKDLIKFQEKIKLDILVHGEFERNDMVEYFAENLYGFLITKNGWVQSYGNRTTKPPIIFSYVKRIKPITVKYLKYAQNLTNKPVKAILTGPITIINWSFPNEHLNLKKIAFSIAQALNKEINDLINNGLKIIQIDEAALRERLPLKKNARQKYLDIAISAFKYCVKDVPDEIQIHTHMCYSEFKDIINFIEKMDVDVISIEASRSDFSILNFLKNYAKKRQIGPGIYDIHSPRIPTVKELIKKIKLLLKFFPIKNLWINPDCGLKTRTWNEIKTSLKNMVKARDIIIKKFRSKYVKKN